MKKSLPTFYKKTSHTKYNKKLVFYYILEHIEILKHSKNKNILFLLPTMHLKYLSKTLKSKKNILVTNNSKFIDSNTEIVLNFKLEEKLNIQKGLPIIIQLNANKNYYSLPFCIFEVRNFFFLINIYWIYLY